MNVYKSIAIDLGTTKFCLAALNHSNGVQEINTVSVSAAGFRKGMLASFTDACNQIASLVELAENELTTSISKVVVGISGSHLSSRVVKVKAKLMTEEIQAHHLESLEQQVKSLGANGNREILHVIPISFQVDQREWQLDPLNLTADEITGKYFVIEGDRNYLTDIIRLLNHNGLEVTRLIAEPLASSIAVCPSERRNLGAIIADIGGGTTDGIIYLDNIPAKLFSINIGGESYTRDLAIGLGAADSEAERMKHHLCDTDLPVPFFESDNKKLAVSSVEIQRIIDARSTDLATLLYDIVAPYLPYARGGLILTGGGSSTSNVCSVLSEKLGTSVKIDTPKVPSELATKVDWLSEEINVSSKHATVIGLIFLDVLEEIKRSQKIYSSFLPKQLHTFASWLREMI